MARKPKYVSLEPAAFLSDEDFQIMTAEERGVYCTIIFYLYQNNGRLEYDEKVLKKLCNITRPDFCFSNILKKFRISPLSYYTKSRKSPNEPRFISHKRVTEELRKAQVYVNRAVKAARARWDKPCSSIAPAMPRNVTKGKVSNTSNSKEKSLLVSDSFRFESALESVIKPKTQSDRTAFKNLSNWLCAEIIKKHYSREVFQRVLDYATESKTGRNPAAMFFATVKRELGYGK